MGIRIEQREIDYGTDCPTCTPPSGNLWPVDGTPESIYIKCMLMDACPLYTGILPNDRIFKLRQDIAFPCHYEYTGPTWRLSFWFKRRFNPGSRLTLTSIAFNSTFEAYDVECPFEYLGIESDLVFCAPLSYARFGMAIIWWNEGVLELLDALNIAPNPRLMTESFYHQDGDRVLKVCDKRDSSNLKIKFEVPLA